MILEGIFCTDYLDVQIHLDVQIYLDFVQINLDFVQLYNLDVQIYLDFVQFGRPDFIGLRSTIWTFQIWTLDFGLCTLYFGLWTCTIWTLSSIICTSSCIMCASPPPAMGTSGYSMECVILNCIEIRKGHYELETSRVLLLFIGIT